MTVRRNTVIAAVTIVAGLITIPAGIVQILQWLRLPRERLVATVTPSEYFGPPPDSLEIRRKLADTITGGDLTYILKLGSEKALSDSVAIQFAARINQNHRMRRALAFSDPSRSSFGAAYRILVENAGERGVTDTKLRIPYLVAWCSTREGHPQTCAFGSGPIELGTLSPQERLSMTAWASQGSAPYYFADFRIAHAQGIGRVEFAMLRGPPNWWDRMKGPLAFGILATVLIFPMLNMLVRQILAGVSPGNEPRKDEEGASESSPEDLPG